MVNKTILIGNLGKDPETRYTQSGTAVTNFSLATSFKPGKDKDPITSWHNIVMFGRVAEVAGEYLSKGAQIYVEGRIEYQSWEGSDGEKKYKTVIVCHSMQMINTSRDERPMEPDEPPLSEPPLPDDVPF